MFIHSPIHGCIKVTFEYIFFDVRVIFSLNFVSLFSLIKNSIISLMLLPH